MDSKFKFKPAPWAGFQWPDSFLHDNIKGKSKAELCADALIAWSIVVAGGDQLPNFGEMMAKIADKLDISGTPESFKEYARNKKHLTE